MKTYAEQEGKKKFNWFRFLNRKRYTKKELEKASFDAGSWITCACGNLCDVLPRDMWGEPEDKKLAYLGAKFAEKVENFNNAYANNLDSFEYWREQSLNTLNKIEKRSTILIKQQNIQ